MVNPGITGTTGTFLVEILQENTFHVIAKAASLTGVMIIEGTISGIEIEPDLPRHQWLERNYNIKFEPHAGLMENGVIRIEFPKEFNGLIADTCGVVDGLRPMTGLSVVTCSVSGTPTPNVLQFTGFAA